MTIFEEIGAFLASLPGELHVFIISALPLIELRVAIPVGTVLGLPWYTNMSVAIIGNMIPIPFILLFITKIFDWMAKFKIFRPIITWLRKKANKHSDKILGDEVEMYAERTESERRKMSVGVFVGLLTFVALPIPGTGAWTGALVAALFDLPRKQSTVAIFIGVVICSVIMALASYGVLGFLKFLL